MPSSEQTFWAESRSLFIEKKRRYAPSSVADTVKPIPEFTDSHLCLVGDDVKLRQVALRELQCGLQGALDAQRSKAF